MDENGEQFVAYFLPTKETLQKREEDKKLGIPYRQEEELVQTALFANRRDVMSSKRTLRIALILNLVAIFLPYQKYVSWDGQ